MKKILSLIVIGLTLVAFVGCSDKTVETNVSVNDIFENIKDEVAKDVKDAGVPEEDFKDGQIPGYMETDLTGEEDTPMSKIFSKEDISEGFILQPIFNVNSEKIIVLKAKDESKVEALMTSLEEIKEGEVDIWSQYLPNQYEKVKNTIIKTEGNYLVYITYSNPEKIEEIFDNSLK